MTARHGSAVRYRGCRPPGRGLARRAAAWLTPALITMSAAGCAAQAATSTAVAPDRRPQCRIGQSAMLSGLPDFVTMLRQTFTQPPGDPGLKGDPRWDMTQYVCGQGRGFVFDDIMYGRYRVQDNSLARKLGYRVGKYPLVPYIGTAVSALPHHVLEAYEVALQFRSAKAAADFIGGGQESRDNLAVHSLPPGFIAVTSVDGPSDGRHERRIAVTGRIGGCVLSVSMAGGKNLAWSDVGPIWASAYQRIQRHDI